MAREADGCATVAPLAVGRPTSMPRTARPSAAAVGADGVEQPVGDAALLLEQRVEQVRGLELRVAGGRRLLDGVAQGLLGPGGELGVHMTS